MGERKSFRTKEELNSESLASITSSPGSPLLFSSAQVDRPETEMYENVVARSLCFSSRGKTFISVAGKTAVTSTRLTLPKGGNCVAANSSDGPVSGWKSGSTSASLFIIVVQDAAAAIALSPNSQTVSSPMHCPPLSQPGGGLFNERRVSILQHRTCPEEMGAGVGREYWTFVYLHRCTHSQTNAASLLPPAAARHHLFPQPAKFSQPVMGTKTDYNAAAAGGRYWFSFKRNEEKKYPSPYQFSLIIYKKYNHFHRSSSR